METQVSSPARPLSTEIALISLTSSGVHLQVEMEKVISLPQKARGYLSGQGPFQNQTVLLHKVGLLGETPSKTSEMADYRNCPWCCSFPCLSPLDSFYY